MAITFDSSPFTASNSGVQIPRNAQIVFVSDMFADELLGGAELTSQAIIDTCPFQIFKVHSHDVSIALLQQGVDRHWIFGNFANMNFRLLPTIVGNISYSILEYDYKYCRHRSPEKHMAVSGVPCDCHNQPVGMHISAFYHGARMLWWMSEAQQQRYITLFPFLAQNDQMVLSSVFSEQTLATIRSLRDSVHETERSGWVRLESESWVKGADAARKWCEREGVKQLTVGSNKYSEVLHVLSSAEGLVYLPAGGDTCPRLVIEAKLLGCKLRLNDNVQHRHEDWFDTDDLDSIENYLANAPSVFWSAIRKVIEHRPKISGYTTTLNCIKQGYPYEQCIRSMLGFCDQIVVVDGGSTDGTWEAIQALELEDPSRILAVSRSRDWSDPRFAVFDGEQKAYARSLCTGDLCWQMDCDEVVHEEDADKVRQLANSLPNGVEIVSLPVIEYWGGPDKVRVDVAPWKWRLSKNDPRITHGIPASLRRLDSDGRTFAASGTDGCDMIYKDTGEPVPHVNFYTHDIEGLRRLAMIDKEALSSYGGWFNNVVAGLPCVFHYSWYDLPRKIRLYREYWTRHWRSLYDQDVPDTAENNYMFDVPWSEVTDTMIEERASQMQDMLGGWIWHQKWDGKTRTPSIACKRSQPRLMHTNIENTTTDSNTVVSGNSSPARSSS